MSGRNLLSAYTESSRQNTGIRERAFHSITVLGTLIILGIAVVIFYGLFANSIPAIQHFGIGFLWSTQWDPVHHKFGALPFIGGTLLTSAMALLIALPVSLGISIFLTQYAPVWLRQPLTFVVELLAAIPSVVYGLWGLFVIAPILANTVNPAIAASPLGLLPFFGDSPASSYTLFTASVVLAIMITPIITSFSREALLQVPKDQRDTALALGLTEWEVTSGVVVPYARAGIFSAAILGLGRALGETMAVTMLVGNTVQFTLDYFKPGYTMSSLLANEFNQTEAVLHSASLYEIGLILFVMSFVVNAIARVLLERLSHQGVGT